MDCHTLFFSQNCQNCQDSVYLKDCFGCNDCFGCQNLRNQKFHFFNIAYSEKEYIEQVKAFHKKYPSKNERDTIISVFFQKGIQRAIQIHQSENCSGDNIRNGKNCHSCFYVFENAENAKYMCNVGLNALNVMDGDAVGANGSNIYESINTALESSNNIFSVRCWGTHYSMYQNECDNSSHCFLCVGLDRKSYCILNKQYTKEEYEEVMPRIIEKMMADGEWGEFFPASMSPFGYNETVASEYFPLSRDSVIPAYAGIQKTDTRDSVTSTEGQKQKINETFLHGSLFNWSDYEAPFPSVEKTIDAEGMKRLPEDITKIPDDILNWALTCEVSGKPFRIIRQELDFYRKHIIPIPKRHPDVRHMDRMAKRNPRKLFERKCDKCGMDMITTYSPDRKEIVYCEECYEREVVG